jgi:hypothetical protein
MGLSAARGVPVEVLKFRVMVGSGTGWPAVQEVADRSGAGTDMGLSAARGAPAEVSKSQVKVDRSGTGWPAVQEVADRSGAGTDRGQTTGERREVLRVPVMAGRSGMGSPTVGEAENTPEVDSRVAEPVLVVVLDLPLECLP